MNFLKELRHKNEDREIEWLEGYKPYFVEDILFRSNELVDECGEVAGAIKKLVRAEWGMPGGIEYEPARGMIEEELADVLISLDRIASFLGIDLEEGTRKKFNKTSDKHGFKTKL